MRATGRGRNNDSFDPPLAKQSRDSDASFASSRPSSVTAGRAISAVELYADRAFQAATIRYINAFFSSHSIPPISTKPSQAPSAKDLSNILTSLLSLLDFPCSKLEDDLGLLLKSLNCSFKFNKSSLRAPNTPHYWPNWLGTIHWLVQLSIYNENLSQSNTTSFAQNNSMTEYALECYTRFIRGEDDLEEVLDKEFVEKLEKEKEHVIQNCRALEKSVGELEAQAEGLRTGSTEREKLEKEKSVLEEDVKKFQAMIAEYTGRKASLEKGFEEKQKELNAKEEERKLICEENEELKKRVELQTFNARDVERMKREMQAVEKEIVDAEVARNSWEDKSWDLDSAIGKKLKEFTTLAMECNQAIRRFPELLVQAELNFLKKEMKECDHRSSAESRKMVEDVQADAHKLDIMEKEKAEDLKASQLRLQEAIQQTEAEIHMHASQLLTVADTVSKYKENVESTVSKMRVGLAETAAAVSDAYKGSLPAQLTDSANAGK